MRFERENPTSKPSQTHNKATSVSQSKLENHASFRDQQNRMSPSNKVKAHHKDWSAMSTIHALKEWDAQIQALESGTTALVIRKGGIVEARGEFEVEHREFWLYPTFLHQNPGELRSPFSSMLRPDPAPGQVSIRAFARAERVWKLEDLAMIRALEPHQCLTGEALERKFYYRNKPWVHALLLRVYRLEPAQMITESELQRGCVSWVPLEQGISLEGLKPSMDDRDFTTQRRTLESLLD
jgi:hypothetical protein